MTDLYPFVESQGWISIPYNKGSNEYYAVANKEADKWTDFYFSKAPPGWTKKIVALTDKDYQDFGIDVSRTVGLYVLHKSTFVKDDIVVNAFILCDPKGRVVPAHTDPMIRVMIEHNSVVALASHLTKLQREYATEAYVEKITAEPVSSTKPIMSVSSTKPTMSVSSTKYATRKTPIQLKSEFDEIIEQERALSKSPFAAAANSNSVGYGDMSMDDFKTLVRELAKSGIFGTYDELMHAFGTARGPKKY